MVDVVVVYLTDERMRRSDEVACQVFAAAVVDCSLCGD
jgi:hypothetical protein